MNLLKEGFFVGIITIIVGIIINYFIKQNNMYFIILNLFITGFVIHIICEISGINKYYCKNGNACKTENLNSEITHPASYK